MNCREFETLVCDLSAGRLMEASERIEAFAHSAECSECARRLSEENILSAGLKNIALLDGGRQAPARVEDALLARFRRKADIPVPAQTRRPPLFRVAAAVILFGLLIAAVAPRILRTSSPEPEVARDSLKTEMPEPPPDSGPARVEEEENRTAPPSRRTVPPARKSVRRKEPASVATGFFPLVNTAALPSPEATQVIRVKLPRTALIDFGLPVDESRSSEPVDADVVFGNDGIARAVRFVR